MKKKIALIIGLILLFFGELLFAGLPHVGVAAIVLFPIACGLLFISALILLIHSWKSGILFSLFLIAFYLLYFESSYLRNINFWVYCAFSWFLYTLFYFCKPGIKLLSLASLVIIPLLFMGVKAKYEGYLASTTYTILTTTNDIQEICIRRLAGQRKYRDFFYTNWEPKITRCSINDSEGILKHIPKSICQHMTDSGIGGLNRGGTYADITEIILNGKEFLKENCESENEMYFYMKSSDWQANEFYNNVADIALYEMMASTVDR